MPQHHAVQNVGDISLATGLGTSPVWAPWLDSVNATLTLLTLLIGIVLGLLRLWMTFREWRAAKREKH